MKHKKTIIKAALIETGIKKLIKNSEKISTLVVENDRTSYTLTQMNISISAILFSTVVVDTDKTKRYVDALVDIGVITVVHWKNSLIINSNIKCRYSQYLDYRSLVDCSNKVTNKDSLEIPNWIKSDKAFNEMEQSISKKQKAALLNSDDDLQNTRKIEISNAHTEAIMLQPMYKEKESRMQDLKTIKTYIALKPDSRSAYGSYLTLDISDEHKQIDASSEGLDSISGFSDILSVPEMKAKLIKEYAVYVRLGMYMENLSYRSLRTGSISNVKFMVQYIFDKFNDDTCLEAFEYKRQIDILFKLAMRKNTSYETSVNAMNACHKLIVIGTEKMEFVIDILHRSLPKPKAKGYDALLDLTTAASIIWQRYFLRRDEIKINIPDEPRKA